MKEKEMKMFKAIAKGYDGSNHYTSEFSNMAKLLDFVFAEFSGWDVIAYVDIVDCENGLIVNTIEN